MPSSNRSSIAPRSGALRCPMLAGPNATSGVVRSTDVAKPAQLVRFVPISELTILFDHLVGTSKQRRWQFEAKRFRCPQVDHQFELGRYLNWQFIRLRASKNAIHVDALLEIKVRE